ncbi:phage terminase large subunit [Pedobacter agri]|uniref:phage terminase large subunit n=1 Tax=Pedobacter agri TaxID=454586 RepID=UPI00292DE075|nr:phage terminase large subunit [Pedobacter agri]
MKQLSKKQLIALGKLHWQCLVKFVFYGGAAGGGKSWLGCFWLMTMCWRFPGTRWFIGRDSLKDTRESVLITWGKVAKEYGYTEWKYVDNEIKFNNGSAVVFLDLSFYPQKDPMFERLGSKEYTGGWIEEAGEVHFAAFDTLKSRVGRHLNTEYGIVPKILITANPKKNWLYTTFWKPFRNKVLDPAYSFIRALYQDNPFLSADYIDNMRQITDKVKRERLLKGNFDYDDNPNALCDYDSIVAIFGGNIVKPTGKFYITADIARLGSDKAVIMVWDGFRVIEKVEFDVSKTTELQHAINTLRYKYNIPNDRCIADEDGVGGGVVDNCGIVGFVNNSSALPHPTSGIEEPYANLQAQCAYKLAEMIKDRLILIDDCVELTPDEKDTIATELEQIQTWKMDNDEAKIRIKPKSEIKKDIGRSPDYRDTLLMRMYFVYREYEPQDLEGVF